MRRAKTHKSRSHTHTATYRGMDNTRILDSLLKRTKIFQDVLGITSEELSTLYEKAHAFLELNRFEEAQSSFAFLTKLNPFASDFWIGLGVSYLMQEQFMQAFDAFIMALTMEPDRYECYAYAIECCTQMRNFTQAEALVKQAVTYAKRHPRHEQSLIILEEAPRLLSQIEQAKLSRS